MQCYLLPCSGVSCVLSAVGPCTCCSAWCSPVWVLEASGSGTTPPASPPLALRSPEGKDKVQAEQSSSQRCAAKLMLLQVIQKCIMQCVSLGGLSQTVRHNIISVITTAAAVTWVIHRDSMTMHSSSGVSTSAGQLLMSGSSRVHCGVYST